MNPQNLAFRLLGLLAPGRDALAGDLLEQVRNGKSALWLWRQISLRDGTAETLLTQNSS
jgi:hypothetical protein